MSAAKKILICLLIFLAAPVCGLAQSPEYRQAFASLKALRDRDPQVRDAAAWEAAAKNLANLVDQAPASPQAAEGLYLLGAAYQTIFEKRGQRAALLFPVMLQRSKLRSTGSWCFHGDSAT